MKIQYYKIMYNIYYYYIITIMTKIKLVNYGEEVLVN